MGEPDLEVKTVEKAIADIDGGSQNGGGPTGYFDPSPDSPPPGGDDVIALLEMGVMGAFVALCGITRTPVDAQISSLAAFSDAEKGALAPYAPYAAQYIPKTMAHQDKLGLIFFLIIGAKTIKGKLDALKAYIEARESFKEEPREPDLTPTE